MAAKRDRVHAGGFIISEQGSVSRDSGFLAMGEKLDAGTLLEENDDGDLVAWTAGDMPCAGVLFASSDATLARVQVATVARAAVVALDGLTFPEGRAGSARDALDLLRIVVLADHALADTNGGGGGYVGPMDIVSADVIMAHSFRAMSAAWTSDVVTITRSSDSVSQSFAPTVSNAVDVDAVASFLGGVDGYVSVLQDQSGNTQDEIPIDAGPGGFWNSDILNGKPGIISPGINTFYTGPHLQQLETPLFNCIGGATVFYVAKGYCDMGAFGGFADDSFIGFNVDTGNIGAEDMGDNSGNEAGGRFNNASSSEVHLFEGRWEFGSSVFRIDGVEIAKSTNWDSGGPLVPFDVFSVNLAVKDGAKFAEMIYYNSLLSDADMTAIRQNIADYYGITLA